MVPAGSTSTATIFTAYLGRKLEQVEKKIL